MVETSKKSPKKSSEYLDDNNNRREKPLKMSKQASKLSDFKLTIITNSILLGVIGYLLTVIYVDRTVFGDCNDYFSKGHRNDGVYEIQPDRNSNRKINVFCNMTAGGLTVLFRRTENSKVNFQNEYSVYKQGFGDLNSDHFIAFEGAPGLLFCSGIICLVSSGISHSGLDNMYLLTRDKTRDLISLMNDTQYRYGDFKVLSEFYHYKLVLHSEIDKYIDGSSLLRLNNSLFSTIDVDYDLAANSNCSSGWKAGWWFTDCFDHSLCMTCMIMHGNQGVKKLHTSAWLIK